jgi:hypothetical protein
VLAPHTHKDGKRERVWRRELAEGISEERERGQGIFVARGQSKGLAHEGNTDSHLSRYGDGDGKERG